MPPPDADEEVEAWRIERLAARRAALGEDDGDGPPIESVPTHDEVGPGTFDCHEALHTASLAMDFVDRHLLDHDAILTNPEWFRLAHRAFEQLFDLYQAIGAAHLGAKDEGRRPNEFTTENDG